MPDFTFRVGDLDLSRHLRVQAGEGWDPADADYSEPQFAESPLREGAGFVQDVVGPREQVWPLALNPRPYVATNAIQNPGLEMGTSMHWGLTPWTGGTAAVTQEWSDAPRGGDWSLKYFGTVGNVAVTEPVIGAGVAGTFLAVPSLNSNYRYFGGLTVAGPSPPALVSLRYYMLSSGAASLVTNVVVASATAEEIRAAWADGERGVRLEGIGTAHPSVAFFRPHLRVQPSTAEEPIATFAQLEMYADNALSVLLTPANQPTAGLPDARVDHFDGDHLDAYWPAERSDSYSIARTGKQGLLDMVENVNQQLAADDLQLRWRDAGASQPTFYDVIRGRLEPDWNYWRGRGDWLMAPLRLWTQPYGHTGTTRVVATGLATGVAAAVFSIPSALAGDISPVSDIRVSVASQIPLDGRLVGLAPLPHASYRAVIGASELGGGATLVIGSGAHASCFLRLNSGLSDGQATVALGPASHYQHSDHRLLAIARGMVELRVLDNYGQLVGVGQASVFNERDWGVVDLGILRVPAGAEVPTPALTIQSRALEVSRDPAFPAADVGYGELTALLTLPEAEAALVVDDLRTHLTTDSLQRYAVSGSALVSLRGEVNESGHRYAAPFGSAIALGTQAWSVRTNSLTPFGVPYTGGSQLLTRFAQSLVNVPSACEMRVEAAFGRRFEGAPFDPLVVNVPTHMIGVHKAGASTAPGGVAPWVAAELQGLGSGGVFRIVSRVGASALIASTFVPSLWLNSVVITLHAGKGRAWATLEDWPQTNSFDLLGSLIASVGGSVGADFRGVPGAHQLCTAAASIVDQVGLCALRADIAPSQALGARDSYRFNGLQNRISRETASGLLSRDLSGAARGRALRLAAPSAAAVVALALPRHQGPAAGEVSVDIRAREQFRFAR